MNIKALSVRLTVSALLLGSSLALAATEPAAAKPPAKEAPIKFKTDRVFMLGIEQIGEQLIGFGERGVLFKSSDQGKTWQSSRLESRSTVTSALFWDAKNGISVGHGGLLLLTNDAGKSWKNVILDELGGNSLLGVFRFASGRLAVFGAFGNYFVSDDNGGNWQRLQVLNEDFDWHISAILPTKDGYLMLGEAGTILHSADNGDSWQKIESPYSGSYFGGLNAADGSEVIYGMRGSIYRSQDGGQTWVNIPVDTKVAFMNGMVLQDKRILLLGDVGVYAISSDSGASFKLYNAGTPKGLADAVQIGNDLITVGEAGIGKITLPQ